MFSYCGFVWDADNSAAGDTAGQLAERLQASGTDWQFALRRPGIAVLYTGSRPPNRSYELAGNTGVVLGKLFVRSSEGDSTAAPTIFGPQETAKLLATGGRHLMQSYWGRYVAFLHETESRTTRIVRRPGRAERGRRHITGLPFTFAANASMVRAWDESPRSLFSWTARLWALE